MNNFLKKIMMIDTDFSGKCSTMKTAVAATVPQRDAKTGT